MPPRKQPPAPVEEPQQEVKPARKGIVVNYDFNTTVPNYVFNPSLWHPTKGRKPSVDALLCYMWCIDKVTSVFEDKDGTPIGVVLNGLPIGFAVIANDANLSISWSSVQRNMKYLEQVGLIRRVRGTIKDKYSYAVLNCRKQFNGKQADGTIRLGGKTFTKKDTAKLTVADVDHLFTHSVMREGKDKGQPCTYCNKCGTHVSSDGEMLVHVEANHLSDLQFLDKNKVQSFNIEGDDELA